ncbi:MAG: cytochrome P450 [Myxococcota bacterium]
MKPLPLADPATFERGMPHEYFAWLRRNEPLHWTEPYVPEALPSDAEQRGFWLVTRYADVQRISRDQETFSSERGGSMIRELGDEAMAQLRLWMINQDSPHHTRLRKLVNAGFTPNMIKRMETHIRELAGEVIDRVARKGECDFVTEVAAELPLLVIAELVGCPVEDRAKLFAWSNALIGFEDPEVGDGDPRDVMQEMFLYADALAAKRRADPREDLASALVHAEVDGQKLDGLAFGMFFILLILAGNETTRNALSGGMLAFSDNPDQQRRLAADRGLLPGATEEILRFVSPVIYMRRTLTREAEVAGRTLPEDAKVVMCYPAANRDESVFDEPDRFDVTRDPNPQLAFGYGPHYCLGANLARAEIRVMFEELFRRLPDIEVSGPVRRLRSSTVASIQSLPVRFTPGS